MYEKLLRTPEGVRDIYDLECEKRNGVIDHIHHTLHMYSYHDIETPSFEFFDIFNMDKGSAPSNEMFKFFDRNNNTLVLRPDMTPSIARCAAKYYPDTKLPIRLCYKGNTFTNAPLHQGKLSESTQIGCELLNDDTSASDAEIIACAIDCLLAAGLTEFQIELGHVDYFNGIIEDSNLTEEEEADIRDFIRSKNFFGLLEYVKALNLSEETKQSLVYFDDAFGGVEMLDEAKKHANNAKSLAAIERMKKIYTVLSYYGFDKYVSFDLSMLNRYTYYTGIVFRGYTYGTGDAVIKGGRYDNLLEKFGKESASIGFAIYVDELMMALSRQHIDNTVRPEKALIIYSPDSQKKAIELAKELRASGKVTELIRKSKKLTEAEYKAKADAENAEFYSFLDNKF